jgi:thioredoxin 1
MVIDAQDTNFQALLKENPKVIVKFYTNWCGNCRLLKPKYKQISEETAYNSIAFLNVNAQNNPETRHFAKLDNLPYFAIFRNGELVQGLSTKKEEGFKTLLDFLSLPNSTD